MKKIVILIGAIILTFSSCGSDDDSSSTIGSIQDPIVGTWKYNAYFEDGVEQSLDNCVDQEVLIFSSDRSYSAKYYSENSSNVCELSETIDGSWISDNNSNYTINADSEFTTYNISFQANTFSYEDSYLDSEDNIIETETFYIR